MYICRSFGLCRVAAWATSQRPMARGASAGPGHAEHPALGQRYGHRRVRDLPHHQPAVLVLASGRSARPRRACPRCRYAAAGSRGRCGGAPTADGAGPRRWTGRWRGRGSRPDSAGARPPGPAARRSRPGPSARRTRRARCAFVTRPRLRSRDVVADHHDRAHRAHGQHVDPLVRYAMPAPSRIGTTAINRGSGRRSCLFGGVGSANLVRRPGGSSRGGRLKSMPAPSCARVQGRVGRLVRGDVEQRVADAR